MRDLTVGSESKNIFFFALPMLIGNIFQQLYNTVDSIVVGRALGKEALAAVGASFPILFLLISLIIGVAMGSTILIAQYYGAKDMEKVRRTIDTAYIFLFFSSLVVTVVGLLASRSILVALNTPPEILFQAQVYLNITFIGLLGMFGYNAISAILRGLGDSKTPLYFLIFSTFVNIGLDLLFILVFGWGVAGAAWATVIAQGLSFVLGIIYLNRTHDVVGFAFKRLAFDREIFRLTLKIGLPAGFQHLFFSLGIIALQALVNLFGTNTIAAYTAAGRIDAFAVMPIVNFGAAISTFVGQNLGAREEERVKKGFRAAMWMAGGVALVMTALVFLFGDFMIAAFNTDAQVIAIGTSYLKIISSFYVVVAFMFIISGVLRGAGDTMMPMVISVITLWLVRVPAAWLLSSRIGTDGIWWSSPVSWVVGFVLTLMYYVSGRWKKKVVVEET